MADEIHQTVKKLLMKKSFKTHYKRGKGWFAAKTMLPGV